MSAKVSVFFDMSGLLVPESFVAGRKTVYDHVDRGRGNAIG
jgi:hypothetical protein